MSKKLVKKLAASMAGGAGAQHLLGWSFNVTRRLMGIGLGKSPDASGERHLVEHAANIAAEDPFRVFDVGANRGEFAELVPNVMQSRPFEVHCFEPSTNAYRLLEQRFGEDDRFLLNPFGLGREGGEATLYSSGPGSRTASLSRLSRTSNKDSLQTTEQVRLTKLDDYCSQRSIEVVHLLKIDVEGHEMGVLSGAEPMLSDGRVRIISFEFGACHIETGFHFQDFYAFFQSVGMTIYRLTPSGYLHPLPKYSEVLEQYGTTNYVASRLDLS